MKQLKWISLILLAVSSLNAHAYLGSRPGLLSLTLGAGYEFFSGQRQIQNTTVPYLAVGYDITQHWGIEGWLGTFNTNFDDDVGDDRTVNGTLFMLDALYHFSPYKWVEPYALAGVGITGFNPVRGSDAHNQGNINVGAGLQFLFNPALVFRAEARDIYSIVATKNDFLIDAGISFLFDLC